MATLDDYRNGTGEFAPDSGKTDSTDAVTDVQDAAEQDEEEVMEEEAEADDTSDEPEGVIEPPEDTDDIKLPDDQKTAFQKALEREKRKLEEEKERIRQEALQEAMAQANPYKEVIDLLGGDPNKIKAMVEQNKLVQEAQQMAYQYGWDEEQAQAYVQQRQAEQRQQDMARELQELRISNQISDLRDNPNFPGIKDMRKDITELVSKSNGTINVEQAYWALGGAKRAEQMRLEIQQREAVKRSKTARKPQNDQGAVPTGEKPIPAEIMAEARKLGIKSEKDIRELMNFNADNIQTFREKRKKGG